MVANVPWQKAARRRVSPAEDRLAMVEAAVRGRPGLEVGRLEIERGGDSYTIDTLDALAAPGRELFLVIGSDLVGELTTWHRWQELPERCTLAVAHRPGAGGAVDPGPPWRAVSVEIPGLDLSSTELRAMGAAGRPLDFLVPDAVLEVIRDRGLYLPAPDDRPAHRAAHRPAPPGMPTTVDRS